MVQHAPVGIVVDSSCCLPKDIQDSSRIHIVPHQLIAGGVVYRDGIDIYPADFYRMLETTSIPTTTSGPTPQAFLETFLSIGNKANEILCLTLSPRFSSSTHEAATIGARMAKSRNPEMQISIMDSQSVAGTLGFLALRAAEESQKGRSMSEIISLIQRLIPQLHLLAFLDTLQYLRKSGKITKAKAWTGTLLGFKPLTELSRGEAKLLSKPRSRTKAINQLMNIVAERMGNNPTHINIMHANAPEDAKRLLDWSRDNFDCRELYVSEFTPVMGSHTGPGLVGIAFYSDFH